MADLNASGVNVELADGSHRLRFTNNRLIDIEDHFDGLMNINAAIERAPLRSVRYLVHVGLVDGPATEEATGDLMDGCPLDAISLAVTEAMTQALGKGDETPTTPTTSNETPPSVDTPSPV